MKKKSPAKVTKAKRAPEIRTVADYLRGQDPEAVQLFRKFEKMVKACGRSKTEAHKSVVNWSGRRIFAGAFIRSGRLEIAIDLRRRVPHPTLRQAWNTTYRVITHRMKIERAEELDETIAKLLCEARVTVGPGTKDHMPKQDWSKIERPHYPMPPEVRTALEEHGLMNKYHQRPPHQQNDYIGWIRRAKRPETRQKRLDQMLDELKDGRLYMNMKWNPK